LDRIEADLDNIVWESTAEGREEAEALSGQKAGINPRSPKQVKEYLESQGIRTDTTNEDTLTGILERSSPTPTVARFIRTLLIHRRQQKLYSTYVDGIRKRIYRGRVYTTYLLHGTTSGRLASRNPNLQNIVRDKDIRRQFSVSKPDNVLIQCDYRNAELRVIATLARDEYLRNLLSNPDPKYKFFNELSDQLYGKDNWTKEDYIRTKAFVYGIGYGREPYSIGLEFNMSVAEANRRYNEFMDLIPATAQWQMDVRKRVLSGADLVTPFGRRRRFWLITEQNKKEVFNEALSYLPQSTASDICVAALTDLRPMLRGLGFIRLTIHDAIVTECHESRADQVGAMMQEVMLAKGKEFTDYVPFPTDISIGKTWGDL
jgi:DNA polymerase-1